MADNETLDMAAELNAQYSAGLVVLQLESGNYDIGMVAGAQMQNLLTDVNDDVAHSWLAGALFGARIGKAMAPAAAEAPKAHTAMILEGQTETVVVGTKANALIVEAYQADAPYNRFMDIPGYHRTNGGDLKVFLTAPAKENVMIRVLEL